MRGLVTTLALVLAAGCRYHPDTVPLHGDREEWRQLAGEWRGSYVGRESGRTGSITFQIRADVDSAYGDVMMHMAGAAEPLMPLDPRDVHMMHVADVQALSVRFVRLADNQVRGALEPYRAPDCRCVARTTFTGRRNGNTIRGSFLTVLDVGGEQHGTWRVDRVKAAP